MALANVVTENAIGLEKELTLISLKGLKAMYDEKYKGFSFRTTRDTDGISNIDLSVRYTIISLIGLFQYEYKSGEKSGFNIQQCIDSLTKANFKDYNLGDIGLLIWLCSLANTEKAVYILSEVQNYRPIESYASFCNGNTVELSWLLTGLSILGLKEGQESNGILKKAEIIYNAILKNYRNNGIFRHLNTSSFEGKLRGRIGCFADQVYPIIAFSLYANASGEEKALKIAVECADRICELQGPLGQWWWHYDSKKGNINNRYPVYAVHQDAMAPMALLTVGKIAEKNYSEYIAKGINWIYGQNELKKNMIDEKNNIIMRCIYRHKIKMALESGTSLFFKNRNLNQPSDLKILFECRSYHLGWILYALYL